MQLKDSEMEEPSDMLEWPKTVLLQQNAKIYMEETTLIGIILKKVPTF